MKAKQALWLHALWLSSCAQAPATPPPINITPPTAVAIELDPDRPAGAGPNGETATLTDGTLRIERPCGAVQRIDRKELHAPPGERSLHGIHAVVQLYLDDGTILVGAEDGILTLIDAAGSVRSRVGLRGTVRGMARVAPDQAAVSTDRGVLALVSSAGMVRWERQVTAEPLTAPIVARGRSGEVRLILAAGHRGVFALSPAGEVAFSHAAPPVYAGCQVRSAPGGGWSPPLRPWTCAKEPPALPVITLSGNTVKVGSYSFAIEDPHPPIPSLQPAFPLTFTRVLEGNVTSLMPDGADGVLALLCESVRDYGHYSPALIKQLQRKCRVIRVAEEPVEIAKLPNKGTKTEQFFDSSRKNPYPYTPSPPEYVVDGMVRGPSRRPWILGRKLATWFMNCENNFCPPPQGAGLVFDLRGGRLTEWRGLFEAFRSGAELPLTGAFDGGRGAICWSNICATFDDGKPLANHWAGPAFVRRVTMIGTSPWLVASGEVYRAKGSGFELVGIPTDAFISDLAGSGEEHIWANAVQRFHLLQFDGAQWSEVSVPPAIGPLHVFGPNHAWSGRMHWDGEQWSLVDGAPDANVVLARGRETWIGGPTGLWRGAAPGPMPIKLPAPSFSTASAPPVALKVNEVEARVAVARTSPTTAATTSRAQPIWVLPNGSGPDPWNRRSIATPSAWPIHWDDVEPNVRVRDGDSLRPVLGLPSAHWIDIVEDQPGGAWFAGGRSPGPTGEGILLHVKGPSGAKGTEHIRAAASLLAVAAVASGEAWAVGAAGTIVHVRDGVVARGHLPSGEWLRTVLAGSDGRIWIGGDGGTLLVGDNGVFRRVLHPLGDHATFTKIFESNAAVFAESPSGTLRLTK